MIKRLISRITIYLFFILGASVLIQLFFDLVSADGILQILLLIIFPTTIIFASILIGINLLLKKYKVTEATSLMFLFVIIILVTNSIAEHFLKIDGRLYSTIDLQYAVVMSYENEKLMERDIHNRNCSLVKSLSKNNNTIRKDNRTWHLEEYFYSWRDAINEGNDFSDDACLTNTQHQSIVTMTLLDTLEFKIRLLFLTFFKTIILSGFILPFIIYGIENLKKKKKIVSKKSIGLLNKNFSVITIALVMFLLLFYLGSIS